MYDKILNDQSDLKKKGLCNVYEAWQLGDKDAFKEEDSKAGEDKKVDEAATEGKGGEMRVIKPEGNPGTYMRKISDDIIAKHDAMESSVSFT